MLSLAFALAVASAISFAFRTTRGIGIVCVSLFCFLFPPVALVVGVIAGVAFFIYYRYFR